MCISDSFSMAHLPLRLKLSNDVLDLGLGLGAVVSSLSPKLGELFGVSSLQVGRVGLSLTGVLGEPGADTQHRSLRTLNGGLRGRLGSDNSRLQSRAPALQSSNPSRQGK